MLDLQKYLNKAAADPGFKKRLVENANQAIKKEFGEDLPYKLKCKQKLVFEIEAMDGLADIDLVDVAGGDDEKKVQNFTPAPLFNNHFKTENVCLSSAPPIMSKVQNFAPAPLFCNNFKTENVCLSPAPPIMNNDDLEGVAGGGPGLKEGAKNAKKWMKQFKSDPHYTYPQPGSSNPSSNPATSTSSEPRNPARAVYGANPSTRYW